MNPFVFSCITPHGGEIIPELRGDNPSRMGTTRANMERLGSLMSQANPEAIIVLTPHGTRINGQFSIVDCERMSGSFEENGSSYGMERLVERSLASAITLEAVKAGLPAGSINFGTSAGPYSHLPLDWGAIVPLRFMPSVPIVVITPSREVSYEKHLEFGKVLADAVRSSGRRVGLIASCDWSHAHDENGPYGYDPAAKQLDEEVVGLIQKGDFEAMMEFSEEYIEAAKPDGIWQTLIMAGAIPSQSRKVEFLSYEAPTYFGLICAIV